MQMLKALARAMVEELQADGQPVQPGDVAERALRGYAGSPAGAERAAVRRELEDYVRGLHTRFPAS